MKKYRLIEESLNTKEPGSGKKGEKIPLCAICWFPPVGKDVHPFLFSRQLQPVQSWRLGLPVIFPLSNLYHNIVDSQGLHPVCILMDRRSNSRNAIQLNHRAYCAGNGVEGKKIRGGGRV